MEEAIGLEQLSRPRSAAQGCERVCAWPRPEVSLAGSSEMALILSAAGLQGGRDLLIDDRIHHVINDGIQAVSGAAVRLEGERVAGGARGGGEAGRDGLQEQAAHDCALAHEGDG